MKAIGFVDEEINQVVAILAAILHIGDIVSLLVVYSQQIVKTIPLGIYQSRQHW